MIRSHPIPRSAVRAAVFVAAFLLTALPAAAELDSRALERTFTIAEGETLRLANLAGKVDLVPGRGGEVQVQARVFAEGRNRSQTEKLLAEMEWVEGRDSKGRAEWALSYPVERIRTYSYPGAEERGGSPSFLERLLDRFDLSSTSTKFRGRSVKVVSGGGAPTLYADLVIAVPDRGRLVVRNVVGDVEGGDLAGDLVVDTGSGKVNLEGFAGMLSVDTGSGSVSLGTVRGETQADTGSGSIRVAHLIGNGDLDTGSGGIEVQRVAAGRLRVDTGSGSIVVRDGEVGDLLADTGSGSIRVLNVEVVRFEADTGSGGVTLESSLVGTREVLIDTGSGGVRILAGRDAGFDVEARQGSGSLVVGYDDAELRKRGHKVVGASRGDGGTRIRVDTGSGSCVIEPRD